MNIGIDARQIIINERGISNYIYNLIENLLRIDKKNKFILYINSGFEYVMDDEKIKQKLSRFTKYDNVQIKDIKSKGFILWEQIYLPWNIFKDKIDVMHMTSNRSPLFCNSRLINTIHDLTEFERLKSKEYYQLKTLKGKFYELRIKQYLKMIYNLDFKRSDLIITISEKSKQEIIDKLGIKENIKIITHGIDKDFKNFNLDKKYIMMLGGSASQKNAKGAIETYSLLSKEIQDKYPLLIVGTDDKDIIKRLLEQYKIKNTIIRGFVSKEELIRLYNKSKFFLFLSTNEGFGFPPLEAMACGCIPLVYNISPMKENINNKELCLKDNKEVTLKIRELILNDKKYKELILFGLDRAKNFSWEKCAREHLKIYEEFRQ